MTTFARIVDGYALDCHVAASAAELAARFHPEWLARNPFIVVPDGTLHGAKDNGNGTFSNPPAPVSFPAAALDKTAAEFESWAIARVGNVAAWQNLLEKCAAQAGTTDNDKAVRYFPRWTAIPSNKSKAEFEARCTPLTLTGSPIISGAALTAVLALW